MPTIVELPGQVEVEFPDGMPPESIAQVILPFQESYGLPVKNRYGQFDVGGDIKGHAGQLDKVYDFMPWRSFDRFMDAAKVETKPDLMGGVKASIADPYGVALEATDLLGLGIDVGDAARIGRKVVKPIAGRIEDAMQGLPTSPWDTQLGAITYHGSPHKFDKFQHSQMGTGEGAQAYGWGTYLAEKPEVAKQYTDSFRAQGGIWVTDDALSPLAESTANNFRKDLKGAVRYLKQQKKEFPTHKTLGDMRPKYDEAIEQIERLKTNGTFQKEPFFYEVDLPDEQIAKMLDWDAPLSDESIDGVMKALGDVQVADTGNGYAITIVGPDGVGSVDYSTLAATPKDARLNLNRNLKMMKGENVYRQLERLVGSDQKASEVLHAAGIPGIKYWDGGSRQAGSGTRNYVVFDEDIMTILKRNGEELQTGGFDRTTTDMPYYDDLINKPDMADYFRDQKGLESRMVDITPDKYLETVDKSFTRGGVMDGIDTDKVSEYAKKMREGEQFPALTLDYAKGKKLSQEGRHRALAAKEAGIDSVPVLVVTPTQEEAEYLGVVVPRLDF